MGRGYLEESPMCMFMHTSAKMYSVQDSAQNMANQPICRADKASLWIVSCMLKLF